MTASSKTGRKTSRRQVGIADTSRWIFNRMADVYDARPAYPEPLIEAIAELARAAGSRIGDLGAGTGHLAIPLAERGFEVTAVEPAHAMLERLSRRAAGRGVEVRSLHAAAESLPLEAQCFDFVVIADALHFIDTERAAHEIARVLVPRGGLAIVTVELGSTPFMLEVARIMQDAAQRKPRVIASRSAQLAGIAKIKLAEELHFRDETPVSNAELERILGSISFIGPAMNPERTAAFRARVHALTNEHPAIWTREFRLLSGRRRAYALPKSRTPTA